MDPDRGREGLSQPAARVERRARADAVTGWRYWQLSATTGLLRSVTHRRFEWPPGQVLRAVCLTGGHAPPAPGCACGIHAGADLAALRDHGLCLAPGDPLVVGEVALWGTVVADEHGLRGEHAAPARLLLVTGTEGDHAPGALAARLAAYAVPVATIALADAVGDVSAALLAFQAMSR